MSVSLRCDTASIGGPDLGLFPLHGKSGLVACRAASEILDLVELRVQDNDFILGAATQLFKSGKHELPGVYPLAAYQ
jgi:hypothetical protein